MMSSTFLTAFIFLYPFLDQRYIDPHREKLKEISTLKIDTFCGVFGLGGAWLYFVNVYEAKEALNKQSLAALMPRMHTYSLHSPLVLEMAFYSVPN